MSQPYLQHLATIGRIIDHNVVLVTHELFRAQAAQAMGAFNQITRHKNHPQKQVRVDW